MTTPATPPTPEAPETNTSSSVWPQPAAEVAPPPPPPAKPSRLKTFFEHVWSFFENDADKLETSAAVAISVATPLLSELISLTAGEPIAAKVSAVATQAVNDLNNTAAMLKGAEAGSADHSVSGLLNDVVTDLPALLQDADIKNSTKSTQITGIVKTVVGEVQAILAALPEDHSVPVMGAPKTA